jgi:serine/threonine protein kinase
METEDRIEKYFKLREFLKYITTSVYDVCVNGKTNFLSTLDKIDEIGKGHFGNAYLASLNNHTFVIKEAIISINDWKKIKDNKKSLEVLSENSYVEEYRIMELLSDNLVKGGFPNFILSYKAAVCETCRDTYGQYSNSCFMTFMEPAMCNFREFIKMPEGKEMISNVNSHYSILYQLFLSLCTLHFKYGIYHRDIQYGNILVLKVKPGGYFRYIMNGKEYFVKNYGYLFCLHDFGNSMILNPDYSSGEFYGTRNVLVNQDGLLDPINCDNSDVINWLDGRTGTDNKFTINSKPDKFIDLTDMKKFPPMEFFLDIILIIIFFRELPKLKLINDKVKFRYDANSAIYLRADMMLDYLYEKPIGVTSNNIIHTFYD